MTSRDRTAEIRKRVEVLLEKIPDESFKNDIVNDVELFIKTFSRKRTQQNTIATYFLVFLENLGRKYQSAVVTRFGIRVYIRCSFRNGSYINGFDIILFFFKY